MTNTKIRSIIDTIEQKESMYNQHAEAIKTNILYICDYFKNKFSLSVDSDKFYESNFRDDVNYTYNLRTSYKYGFEVLKCYDDGEDRIIQLCDLSTKMLRIIIDDSIIEKLLEVYVSKIVEIESLYSYSSSRSQILKDEISNITKYVCHNCGYESFYDDIDHNPGNFDCQEYVKSIKYSRTEAL